VTPKSKAHYCTVTPERESRAHYVPKQTAEHTTHRRGRAEHTTYWKKEQSILMYRDTKEQSTLLNRDTTVSRYSSVVSRYRSVVSRYSSVMSRYRSVASRYRSVVSRYSSVASRYSSVVSRYSSVVSRYRSVLCPFFRSVVCSALSLRCHGTEVCSALPPALFFFLQDKRDDESLGRQRCTNSWDLMSCLSEYVEFFFYTNRAHSRKKPDI